ncbi:hypothetical protein [Parapedobacter pyrenivorans]|nr:hypothetical protein [Parapedobacter pyrenivorans]
MVDLLSPQLIDQLQQVLSQPIPFDQFLKDVDWGDIEPCDEFIL